MVGPYSSRTGKGFKQHKTYVRNRSQTRIGWATLKHPIDLSCHVEGDASVYLRNRQKSLKIKCSIEYVRKNQEEEEEEEVSRSQRYSEI